MTFVKEKVFKLKTQKGQLCPKFVVIMSCGYGAPGQKKEERKKEKKKKIGQT
tara:strand:+ start:113 stop:268 length:156 start_codon:yes stop_codon:yes gene_type:complete